MFIRRHLIIKLTRGSKTYRSLLKILRQVSSLLFSNYLRYTTDTAKHTSLKNTSGLGFDRLCATYFLTLYEIATLVWVATPTVGTTGLNA